MEEMINCRKLVLTKQITICRVDLNFKSEGRINPFVFVVASNFFFKLAWSQFSSVQHDFASSFSVLFSPPILSVLVFEAMQLLD